MVQIKKGMYGLKQAGRLAQERLLAHLQKHGYYQCPNTPCLIRHRDHDIAFSLVVDDFGVKYKQRTHADHLISALQELYSIKINWTGDKYLGMNIIHDAQNSTIKISLPHYVERALKRFGVTKSANNTDSPSPYVAPRYGSRVKFAHVDDSAPLDAARTKRLQEIIGVFLYYARAVDPTMRVATSKLSSRQSAPTEAVWSDAQRLLQYAATWPNAITVFRASDMILRVHSDAGHLAETKSRSRAGGIHYLGNINDADLCSHPNGAVDIVCSILPSVAQAAAEAEYGAMFLNGQAAEPLRQTLLDLGYPQPPTPMICDNTTAVGIAKRSLKQKKSQAFDMRYHWIRDRQDQGHFDIKWYKGQDNLADYFTKCHPVHHFKACRHFFVMDDVGTHSRGDAQERRNERKRSIVTPHVISKGVLNQTSLQS